MAAAALAVVLMHWAPASTRPASIANALDRYAQGDRDALTSLISDDGTDHRAFVAKFAQDAASWIAAGKTLNPRRPLVASTFALDAANLLAHDWDSGRRLLAWGCGALRAEATPQPADKTWELAFVALAEGHHDDALLLGSESALTAGALQSVQPRSGRPDPGTASLISEIWEGHLAHAKARFPDELRFRLAEAVAIQDLAWNVGSIGRQITAQSAELPAEIPSNYLTRLAAAPNTKSSAVAEDRRIAELRRTVSILDALIVPGPMLAEVHLYDGVSALRLGDRTTALQHFEDVRRLTVERRLRYMADVLAGLVHERSGEWSEAIASYRAALETVPHARTPATLLTAALLRSGQSADAAEFAADFLRAPDSDDPWDEFWGGDYRLLGVYLEQLRRALP